MEILTKRAVTYEEMCLHYRGAFHRSELAGVAYCIKNYNWKYDLVLNQWRYMAGSSAVSSGKSLHLVFSTLWNWATVFWT